MNNNRSFNFKQAIFWLYYTKGLLQTKLGQHNEAVQSFTVSIDYKNYAKIFTGNYDIAQQELCSHRQALKALEKTVNTKISSSSEIVLKSSAEKLLQRYNLALEFFIELVDLPDKGQIINIPDFAAMFEIPLEDDNNLNDKLQRGYAHYHKAHGQIKLKRQKEALRSLNMSNKLLPNFSSAYITKANIYKEQKNYIETVLQYDQAIRIDNNNADLYFDRSVALFELGKIEQAENDFDKYQSLIQNNNKN